MRYSFDQCHRFVLQHGNSDFLTPCIFANHGSRENPGKDAMKRALSIRPKFPIGVFESSICQTERYFPL